MCRIDPRKRHGGIAARPRPWRVVVDEWGCNGIVAADGTIVCETDSGYYSPDTETAEFICKCVNERKEP